MKVSFLLMLTLLLAVAVIAPVSSVYAKAEGTEQSGKKVKKGKENRECRRVKETGSRIATRVCKNPQQWVREEDAARENIEQTREGANRNTGTAGQQ
jgi:hypothetical protein